VRWKHCKSRLGHKPNQGARKVLTLTPEQVNNSGHSLKPFSRVAMFLANRYMEWWLKTTFGGKE
jgi:hypothetical protein